MRKSFLSKNGTLIPALPINTLGVFLNPEIMYATSGGAFTYPIKKINKINNTITIPAINLILIILTPFFNINLATYKIFFIKRLRVGTHLHDPQLFVIILLHDASYYHSLWQSVNKSIPIF